MERPKRWIRNIEVFRTSGALRDTKDKWAWHVSFSDGVGAGGFERSLPSAFARVEGFVKAQADSLRDGI
jgi:hypothetical protein